MNAEVLIKFKGDTSDADSKANKLSKSMGGVAKSITLGNIAASAITKGFELMVQNMDRAIERIDTMNNFPKVMQNFGVSAEEADASVKRIDKSVRGLPTSLDQAVAGVQDLFMVTKDLKESENLFKAVNDSAMVFANGSTDAVNRFIYAYRQSLSMGKVHAQEFNQMNEAIPGVMDKVAESMGLNFADMKEQLSDGSISMEQFNNALKKIDTEGVGSMEALEKGAKTATGGIQTSIANMKTAFVRGVASIVTTVDKSLSSFGGLTGVITKLGKVGEEAFKIVGDVLKEIMPILMKLIKTIMPVLQKGFKQIMPSIQKIAEALLPAISRIMEKITPILAYYIDTLMPIIASLLDAIVPLIEPLTDMILQLIDLNFTLIQPLLEIAQVILPPLISVLSTILRVLLPAITLSLKFLTDGIGSFIKTLKNVVDFVVNNWQTVLTFIVNPIAGALKLVYDKCAWFRDFVNSFVENITSRFNLMKDKIVNSANNIINAIKSIPSKISGVAGQIFNMFTSLPSKMGEIGLNIVKGIGKGITNGVGWIKARIKEFVGDVTAFLKRVFKIGSPSRLMADQIGQWIPKGIAVGIDDNASSIFKSMKDLTNDIGLSPSLTNSMKNSFSPNVQVFNNVNVEQDPLGQVVSNIKTFSGGAKNDYNYGLGV